MQPRLERLSGQGSPMTTSIDALPGVFCRS